MLTRYPAGLADALEQRVAVLRAMAGGGYAEYERAYAALGVGGSAVSRAPSGAVHAAPAPS